MILRRLGNKSKLAKQIQRYFPTHQLYIELFFGAGGMFFNKPKAQYNILNDIDSEVINLYNVILNQRNEFQELFEITPYSYDLLQYWKTNKESDPVKRAVRFICLSNYGYLGQPMTIKFSTANSKQIAINNIKTTYDFLKDCSLQFMNFDFRKALKSISFRRETSVKTTFIYCDPPYLHTRNNYNNSFTEQDFVELLDLLQEKKDWKFAVSEFDNPFVIEQAKQRNLNVYIIGERRNLNNNRRTEILITNYDAENQINFETI
jgi:DNA adenine methylase